MNDQPDKAIAKCIRGFEHVNRFWMKGQNIVAAKILPGEYYVTFHNELITTVLGSCISVCAYDPHAHVGGMNHFMLPVDKGNPGDLDLTSASFRYGDVAMERLINDLLKNGATKKGLIFKAFGGGQIIKGMTAIGQKNIDFLRKFMNLEGLRLEAEDLGGPYPRKINFYPTTGKVMQKRLEHMHNDTIVAREEKYVTDIAVPETTTGDIDLFD